MCVPGDNWLRRPRPAHRHDATRPGRHDLLDDLAGVRRTRAADEVHGDELGNTTRQEWDARGLPTKTLKDLRAGGTGAGAITSTITNLYEYDLGGRLTSFECGVDRNCFRYDGVR